LGQQKDKDHAFLLLCSLPSSYKNFKEAIIYEGKSAIKVNEVKEHLLKKDKIDNQLTSESYRDDSGQVHFSKEKSNNGSSIDNPKLKNLMCNWYHKKRQIRADCWTRNKKQPDTSVAELAERDEEKCDVLSVTDRSVDNKDK